MTKPTSTVYMAMPGLSSRTHDDISPYMTDIKKRGGNTKGSIGQFMANDLGIDHKGGTGMMKPFVEDNAEHILYHQNKSANAGMAAALSTLVLGSARNRAGKMKKPSELKVEQGRATQTIKIKIPSDKCIYSRPILRAKTPPRHSIRSSTKKYQHAIRSRTPPRDSRCKEREPEIDPLEALRARAHNPKSSRSSEKKYEHKTRLKTPPRESKSKEKSRHIEPDKDPLVALRARTHKKDDPLAELRIRAHETISIPIKRSNSEPTPPCPPLDRESKNNRSTYNNRHL